MGYNLQRFSPLNQINKADVKQLVPAWNYSYDDNRSEESQPLVYKGVLYVTTNSATMAVDAKTGKQIWKTKVEYPPETPRIVCCGIINRGAALYDGKLFRTTLDANVIALDAKTGKELWRQNAADIKDGYSMTWRRSSPTASSSPASPAPSSAPATSSTAGTPTTGKHLWRTYTVPPPGEPGGDTWQGDTGEARRRLDLDHRLVRSRAPHGLLGHRQSRPVQRRPSARATTSTPARSSRSIPRPARSSGTIQFSPNNPFDYDSVAEMVLADINGRRQGRPKC